MERLGRKQIPRFTNSIEYIDTEGGEVILDGITSVSTVDASSLSVASAQEAQHAVNADSATNVATNINGKAISDILESDGLTVKTAKRAKETDFTHSEFIKVDEETHASVELELGCFYFCMFTYSGDRYSTVFYVPNDIVGNRKQLVALQMIGMSEDYIRLDALKDGGVYRLDGSIERGGYSLWDNINDMYIKKLH